MRLRKAFGKVHLWFSLVVGLFIVILCVTGSFLVFRNDINRALNPELYMATPGERISLEQVYSAVSAAHPKGQIQRINTPEEPSGQTVYLARVKEGKMLYHVYVDPGTGKVLGELTENSLVRWISQVHYYLLLNDYKGFEIVGIIGFILCFIVVTGVYLWWPGRKRWVQGFKIKRGTNSFVKQNDLHKVIGIYSTPLLIVIALTGAIIPFEESILGWFGIHEEVDTTKLSSQPLPVGKMQLDKLAGIAQEAVPDSSILQVRPAIKPEDVVQVRLSRPSDPEMGNVKVFLDQYSGKVLAVMDRDIVQWLYLLHIGTVGGITAKIIYALIGLVPVLSMVTGLYIWLYKRKARRKPKAEDEPIMEAINN